MADEAVLNVVRKKNPLLEISPGIADVYSVGRHDGLVLGTVYKYRYLMYGTRH